MTGYRKIKPNLKNWLYSKLYPHSQIRMFQRFLDTMSQNLESNFTKSEWNIPISSPIQNKKPHKAHKYKLCEDMFSIQTLGRRDLSGCFLVHICAFYSSYSSYFAFLYTSSNIFRAILEPSLIFQDLIQISWKFFY